MPLADAARSFEFMHAPHVAAMLVIAATAGGLCVAARKLRRPAVTGAIARALAIVVVLNEVSYWVWALSRVSGREFLQHNLPLHICGAGVFVAAVVMFTRNQFLYEVLYFWALAGTVQATVTPDLVAAFPEFRFFLYFIAHGGVIACAAFATWGMGMRPGKGSVWRVYFFTLACTVVVGAMDWLLDANYMFLCKRADGASPFFFLDWPWYIAFIAAVGLGLFWLLYLPVAIARRRAAKIAARAGGFD